MTELDREPAPAVPESSSTAVPKPMGEQGSKLGGLDGVCTGAGAVVMVYDHRRRRLAEELTGRQHRTHHDVIASLHVHLDEGTCLEIIALRGTAGRIRRVADELLSLKGVKHGRFIETAVGKYV